MPFVTPIYDRTLADVAYVFTHQGATADLKGALNVSDLNRVEGNTEYIHQQLVLYGYTTSSPTFKTNWVNTDFIYLSDIDRIRQNIIDIIAIYPAFSSTPTLVVGQEPLSYLHMNDIEKVLFDLDTVVNLMIENFKYCGTFTCGDSFFFPQDLGGI